IPRRGATCSTTISPDLAIEFDFFENGHEILAFKPGAGRSRIVAMICVRLLDYTTLHSLGG
ncbi:MAG: hypothetical protein OXQ89_14205, partial [Rhodospirillaceae bacterium]|nr:hypothetical protein [Rhodospirillaceae bacterium]